MEAARAAVAAHRPLGPTYGNPQQQESAEVGNHEGAASIGDRLTRKAEKITQTHRRTGDGQDDTQAGIPPFGPLSGGRLHRRHQLIRSEFPSLRP